MADDGTPPDGPGGVAGDVAGGVAGGVAGDIVAIARQVGWPDAQATATTANGLSGRDPGLGALAELAGWLAAVQGNGPPTPPVRVRLVLLGAEAATEPMLAAAARAAVGVRAMPVPDAEPLSAGMACADAEVDSGADLLVLATPAADFPVSAAVLVAAITEAEPVRVVPAGLGTSAWVEAVREVRDRRRGAMPVRNTPDRLLAEIGGNVETAAAGLLLQAARRRTPVVIDGLRAVAAALVAQTAAAQVYAWWQLADTSGERAHQLATERLGLTPILQLGTSTGDGTAGVLAVEVLRAAVDCVASVMNGAEGTDGGGGRGGADSGDGADGVPAAMPASSSADV